MGYVDTHPHFIVICTKDINIGDQLLLDDTDDYSRDHHQTHRSKSTVGSEIIQEVLQHTKIGCEQANITYPFPPLPPLYNTQELSDDIKVETDNIILPLSSIKLLETTLPINASVKPSQKKDNYIATNTINHKILSCQLRPDGVEVRHLPSTHSLYGEKGLYATKNFKEYDIIGEYTGLIVGPDIGGHYCACLEDKPFKHSLSVDALLHGNEMRFINSYLNINKNKNLTLQTVYINTYPHLILICTKDIFINDEFLLDYGAEYTTAYLMRKPPLKPYTIEEMEGVLPFYIDDDDIDKKQNK
mmetsp:Transcript_20101/g.20209  ORF Transcript_20101/g.20209 Transcript_20101/m.20209 type:complete len:301 (-) Transcript_20101:121-1023(-)